MSIEFVKAAKYPNLLFVEINNQNKAAISNDGRYLKTIGYIPCDCIDTILAKMKELQNEGIDVKY